MLLRKYAPTYPVFDSIQSLPGGVIHDKGDKIACGLYSTSCELETDGIRIRFVICLTLYILFA